MGRPGIDIKGQVFGRLTVVSRSNVKKGKYWAWECRCECGNVIISTIGKLTDKTRPTRSCGCIGIEKHRAAWTTHGRSQTKTYWAWHNMKHRCSDENHPSWSNYGGRGIRVCDRWKQSIENFIADMGLRPPKMELDRIDPNGDYCPENCRWVTRKTNMNNKRNNHRLEYNGETLTLTQWQDRTGLKLGTIRGRILAGWSVADALTKPLMVNQFK